MDTIKFDSVARRFGRGMTRREALRGLVAGAVAVTAGGTVLSVEDASAKRRRRRKNRKQNQNQNQDQNQHQDQDHCGRHGDGCGALDADTGEFTPPYCCHGYECTYSNNNGSTSWTCQAVH